MYEGGNDDRSPDLHNVSDPDPFQSTSSSNVPRPTNDERSPDLELIQNTKEASSKIEVNESREASKINQILEYNDFDSFLNMMNEPHSR